MARAARQLELAGVFASAITPRRKNSQDPDVSGLLDLLDFVAAGGVHAICLFGPAGELVNYSFAERQRLVYLGVKRSRVPLVADVSHSTLEGAVQLADEAIASGADGLILMPPYFYSYSQREIEEFYVQFAEETGDAVPILIHNLPQAASQLGFDLIHSLINTGRFSGILDSNGDPEFFARLVELRQTRPFALFNGDDRTALSSLRAGANGLITGTACPLPELLARLYRAVVSNDELQAEVLNARLLEFADWAAKFPFPTAIKRAVELRGQKSSSPLTPLATETSLALEEFSRWFTGWLPQTKKSAAFSA